MAGVENLYDNTVYFKLLIGSVEKFIREPIGWDKVKIILDRDVTWYGFNFEFIDPKIELEFPRGNGYEEIKSEYEKYKGDASVFFVFGYIDENFQQQELYKGKLNFNDFSRDTDTATAPIDTQAFESLFRVRYETLFDLTAVVDADNNPVTPPTPVTVKLHSKRIVKQTLSQTPDDQHQSSDDTFQARYRSFLLPDFSNAAPAEIQDIAGTSVGFLADNPRVSSAYELKCTEDGPTTIKYQASYYGICTAYRKYQETQLLQFVVTPVFAIVRGGQLLEEYYVQERRVQITNRTGKWQVEGQVNIPEFQLNRDLKKNDEVYISLLTDVYNITNGDALITFQFRDYSNTVSFIQGSELPASYCTAYRLGDALSHCITCATGKNNTLVSNFLQQYGNDWLVTNGFQIRNFSTTSKPVQASIKTLMDTMQAIWNIGLGFKDTPAGEVAALEVMANFFNPNPIYVFDNIWDYSEDHASNTTFNELEIGYNKYQDGDLNTLDEYNTYHGYSFPIRTFKAKKTIKCPAILSGYSLENQRREQFKDNPSTSLTNDDEIFLIDSVTGTRVYSGLYWKAVNNGSQVSFSKILDLQPGQYFVLTGGQNKNNEGILYSVISKVNTGAEIYNISPAPKDDETASAGPGIFAGGMVININGTEAAKDEKFGSITNLISPETSYNLRAAPKFMLNSWSNYFNVFLAFKQPDEIIKNTFVKQNKDLTSIIAVNDIFVPAGTVTQGSDVILANFNRGNQPYQPTEVSFKVNMKFSSLIFLKQKLRGEGNVNPELNNGCIVFKDDENKRWLGYPMHIEYEPGTQVADFKVIKISSL